MNLDGLSQCSGYHPQSCHAHAHAYCTAVLVREEGTYYLAIVGIKTEGVVWCCVLTAELDKAPNSTNDVHDSELRPIYSYGTAVMY